MLIIATFTPGLAGASDKAAQPSQAERRQIASCTAKARKREADPSACIGKISLACQERPDMQSTAGSRDCIDRERTIWDRILNRRYQQLRKILSPEGAEKLRDVQRIWLQWIQAKCQMPYVLFEGGTMAGPMASDCIMTATARRAVELGNSLASLGNDP